MVANGGARLRGAARNARSDPMRRVRHPNSARRPPLQRLSSNARETSSLQPGGHSRGGGSHLPTANPGRAQAPQICQPARSGASVGSTPRRGHGPTERHSSAARSCAGAPTTSGRTRLQPGCAPDSGVGAARTLEVGAPATRPTALVRRTGGSGSRRAARERQVRLRCPASTTGCGPDHHRSGRCRYDGRNCLQLPPGTARCRCRGGSGRGGRPRWRSAGGAARRHAVRGLTEPSSPTYRGQLARVPEGPAGLAGTR